MVSGREFAKGKIITLQPVGSPEEKHRDHSLDTQGFRGVSLKNCSSGIHIRGFWLLSDLRDCRRVPAKLGDLIERTNTLPAPICPLGNRSN